MPRLILLNKPYGVLCQFSPAEGRRTLKDFVPVPAVYPAGRLDADSEGLVLLTADGRLQAAIADPRHKLEKGYWVQVEGTPTEAALERFRRGLELPDGPTRPASARPIPEPAGLWAREPPIRVRKAIPTAWLEVGLREGRNRQVRRMLDVVGHPVVRLRRVGVGPLTLGTLAPGRARLLTPAEVAELRRAVGLEKLAREV